MANITKKVTKNIGATQYWDTATDLNDSAGAIVANDVFRIEESLGKTGRRLSITTAGAALSIRINAYNKIYPSRNPQEFFHADYNRNISVGVDCLDRSQTPIVIPASTTYTFNDRTAIRNIQIVTMSANFTLTIN